MGITTEKKITVPWVKQQPHLETGWTEAKRLLAEGMPDYFGKSTVARLSAEQNLANRGIMGYTRGGAVSRMNQQAQRQMGRGYAQSQNIYERSMGDAQKRANQIGGYGTQAMNYGQGAMQRGMTQGQYSNITPFQSEQLQDMLAGKVNTDQLGAVTKAMGRDIMGTLSDPGGILSQIRQQTTNYQPGGGSRTDMVAGLAGKEASQRLVDPSASHRRWSTGSSDTESVPNGNERTAKYVRCSVWGWSAEESAVAGGYKRSNEEA